MANTKLTRTFGSGGSGTKWTLSAWIKRSATGIDQYIMSRYVTANKYVKILFNDQDTLEYSVYNNNAGGYQGRYKTTAKYRDTSAWYHIVIAQDTSLGTAADRVKFYINGELITSFGTNSQLGQNVNGDFNTATPHQIGAYNSTNYFQGSMSHFHFCDNQQYAASYFGSVDSVTGEWKINTSPSVNYGTTGFLVLKDGTTVTDQSSNSNNWSVGSGTLTKTQDCPSNVFATWNSLDRYYTQAIFSNGNATVQTPNASETYCTSTLGMSSGKYYMEVRTYDGSNQDNIGIVDSVATANNGSNNTYQKPYAWVYRSAGNVFNNDNNLGGTFASYQSNHNIMVAVDLDNNKIYFGKDGTWQNSGNPASGSTGTGGFSITASSSLPNGCYFFTVGDNTTGDDTTYRGNFGNGHFGSTAISSAGTNASGNGIFEYDVPSGYTALSTKGLNL